MPLLMCPNDNTPMQEINRNGVQIDVCPQCRGVWLDRGELEKLLTQTEPESRDEYRERERQDTYRRDDEEYYKRHKKKRSLFDFFD